jgi:hypothetical protein
MLQRVTDGRISPSFLLALIFARYRYDSSVRAKPLAKPVRHGSVTAARSS